MNTKYPLAVGILALLFCLHFYVIAPNFVKTSRDPLFDCWAMQKRVAGALEMYNLGNNTKVKQLDDAIIKKLVDLKYLDKMPEHTYRLDDKGEVLCLRHGYSGKRLKGGQAVLDELEKRGCKNENLLSEAAAVAVSGQTSARQEKYEKMVSYRIRYAVGFIVLLCFTLCYWGGPFLY